MSAKMESALQFPTAADLKDLQEVEGEFGGLSFMDSHPFFMLFHFIISILSNYNVLFYFAALQPEQELDLAQLVEADTQEVTEYGKKHTLELLRKIREQLTEVGLQAAVLPEDVAQKYILAVSV